MLRDQDQQKPSSLKSDSIRYLYTMRSMFLVSRPPSQYLENVISFFKLKYKITQYAVNQGLLNCLLYFKCLLCKLKAAHSILLFLTYALSIQFLCLSLLINCLSALRRIQHNINIQNLIRIISAASNGMYMLVATNNTFNFDFILPFFISLKLSLIPEMHLLNYSAEGYVKRLDLGGLSYRRDKRIRSYGER